MGELKFRAWNINKFIFFGIEAFCGFTDIVNCPINQFTGLKDKNGKEIYEGDIVHKSDWCIWVVEYDDTKGCFIVNNLISSQRRIEWDCSDMVVRDNVHCPFPHAEIHEDERFDLIIIGNIYENKELLK